MENTQALNIGQEPESQPEVDVSKIVSINRQSFLNRLRAYTKKPWSMVGMLLVMLAAIITVAIVLWILIYIWSDEGRCISIEILDTRNICGNSIWLDKHIHHEEKHIHEEYEHNKDKEHDKNS